jgi:hypothetical protein
MTCARSRTRTSSPFVETEAAELAVAAQTDASVASLPLATAAERQYR